MGAVRTTCHVGPDDVGVWDGWFDTIGSEELRVGTDGGDVKRGHTRFDELADSAVKGVWNGKLV